MSEFVDPVVRVGRRGFLRGAGLGVAALTSATARSAAAQSSVVADELRLIGSYTPYGLDPVHEFTPADLRGLGAGESLLEQTPTGEVVAALAHSFETLDVRRIAVRLRPEAVFWSGRAVNARAVLDSLERSRALAPPAATLLRGVRIEPVDEWTIVFDSDTLPAAGSRSTCRAARS